MDYDDALLHPPHFYGRQQVLAKPSPIPVRPGVYAWYFREVPPGVPVEGCHWHDGLPLLYLGISPKRPPSNGKPSSRQLGCLLADQLGINLTRVGSGKRHTFTNPGEIKLDAWLERNALVCWVEHPRPWELEERLIKTISLPLNIDGNDHHPNFAALRACRLAARVAATAADCVVDSGGPRSVRLTALPSV